MTERSSPLLEKIQKNNRELVEPKRGHVNMSCSTAPKRNRQATTLAFLTCAIARSTTASPSLAPAGIVSLASSAQSIAHRCIRFYTKEATQAQGVDVKVCKRLSPWRMVCYSRRWLLWLNRHVAKAGLRSRRVGQ